MAVLEIEETVNMDVEIPTSPAHPVLLEMAELIARRGWCQGAYEDAGGHLCIQGAYTKLLERNDSWLVDDEWELPYLQALAAFEKSVAEDMGAFDGEHWDAADWNDQPSRTRLQVIDRLRRVGWTGR